LEKRLRTDYPFKGVSLMRRLTLKSHVNALKMKKLKLKHNARILVELKERVRKTGT
jgi:hypothetical protein